MGKKTVLSTLIFILLMFAAVVMASAQTRTVGVSIGNSFRYSLNVAWSSDDPNATIDPGLKNDNDTQWLQSTVTVISGTNITGQVTAHYRNGTETINGGWVDVNTGNGENLSTLFISANLNAGDSIYNSSSYNSFTINDTVQRIYSSGVRSTDHIRVTSSYLTQSYDSSYYWDIPTGVLVEVIQTTVNKTGAYTTTSSLDLQIISSDAWTVPEFPNLTLALLMLIALTPAILFLSKRGQ
jgi:hypothetical protein